MIWERMVMIAEIECGVRRSSTAGRGPLRSDVVRCGNYSFRTRMVASTWLGGHHGKPSAPLIRCVKPSKYRAITNILDLESRGFPTVINK